MGGSDVFFQATPCLAAHVHAILNDSEGSYPQTLEFLCASGTFAAVPSGVRSRILAALHITGKHKAIPPLLKYCEASDVAKALNLLDRTRKLKQLKEKVARIEGDHPHLIQPSADPGDRESTDANKEATDKKEKRKKRRKIDIYRNQIREIESLEDCDPDNSGCASAHTDTAVTELIQSASVSGALARKIRTWAKSLSSDFLEYVMLALPPDTWRSISDLVHFNPNDFVVPYFLAEIHRDVNNKRKVEKSGESSERTFVASMREFIGHKSNNDVDARFLRLAAEFEQVYLCYSYIRTHPSLMKRTVIVEKFASHMPLETAIWYFEELYDASPTCGNIIHERLKKSEDIDRLGIKSKATYGKLIERIRTIGRLRTEFEIHMEQMVRDLGLSQLQAAAALRKFKGDVESAAEWVFEDPGAVAAAVERERDLQKLQEEEEKDEMRMERENITREVVDKIIPIAGSRLEELKASWKKDSKAKVAVFGDASESMQCAIEAATIFASMVAVCFDAELSFFSHKLVRSPHEKPKNVSETLAVCDTIQAKGCTSLAAALWPFYSEKKSMDVFVMVTDECENEPYRGFNFAHLLAKYKTEVNANVTLIVVCVGKGDKTFRKSLVDNNIDCKVVYIDESRPDLAKFDALLGRVALLSSWLVEKEERDNGFVIV